MWSSEKKEEFEKEFLRFQSELRSYAYRLVTHRQQSEDIVQETYMKAFEKLDKFKGNSSFKTWAFSIATNLARDYHRTKERWGTDWMDLVRDAHVQNPELLKKKFEVAENSVHGKFVIHEHLNYCFNCVSKTLLLEQQLCFFLKEIYGFAVKDIMLITGMSEGKVKHALADSRKIMTDIFKHKCALINKEGICGQCTGLNQLFNPEQDAHIEASKIKMVKEQEKANYNELLDLRLQVVRSIDPLNGQGIDLHNYLIENSPAWARMQKEKSSKN